MLKGQEAWRTPISLAENGRNQANHKSYDYLGSKGGLSRIYSLWPLLLHNLNSLKMLSVNYNPPKMQSHCANTAFPETKPLSGWGDTTQSHL